MTRNTLVIGAGGDVGQGVCASLLAAGFNVTGTGRDQGRLEAMAWRIGRPAGLTLVTGDLSTEHAAHALASRASTAPFDAVVVSVNVTKGARPPLLTLTAADLLAQIDGNLVSHFIALKVFMPLLKPGGVYIAVGGGMADRIVPGNGVMNVCQAALRNMVRVVAREHRDSGLHIKEMMIVSPVAGHTNRDKADPAWLTDAECGRHAAAIVTDPQRFPGTVLALRSREQVGQPEAINSGT